MRITIAERLKPFSHKPGTVLMLPGSSISLSVFPTRLFILDLAKGMPQLVANVVFNLEGPMVGFTVIQDLEKGLIQVFGETADGGYIRYSVQALEDGKAVVLFLERGPDKGIEIKYEMDETSEKSKRIFPKEKMVFSREMRSNEELTFTSFSSAERLSLGSHKQQDWELVHRRLSFTEIFPIWHRLGQLIPPLFSKSLTGTALLLEKCQEAIAANAPDKVLVPFRKLFISGFSGILSPRLIDCDFQGIKGIDVDFSLVNDNKATSLILLTEGAKLIRSLFLQEKDQEIRILPALPPEFHCGRFLDIKCAKEGLLSLEWTKKSLRQMTFTASKDQRIAFAFFNHERKCRIRTSNKDRGVSYVPGTQLDIVAGQNYWLDNFER